jgi:predicted TIM-barrel fold metal-dependent hydrolase
MSTRASHSLLLVACAGLLHAAAAVGDTADESVRKPVTSPSGFRAEHHLHIRSAATADLIRQIDEAAGETALPGDAGGPITGKQALEALDAASISRGLVLSVAYRLAAPEAGIENEERQVRAENEYVAAQVAVAPDRLIGACSVNPLKDYAEVEIRRCAADPHIGAMKFHFTNSGIDLRDDRHLDRLAAIFRLLGELDLPAVVHLRTLSPEYGAEDARRFVSRVLAAAPGLHVQVAHMAGWGGYDDATDAALGYFGEALKNGALDPDRISFDLAAVVFDPEAAGDDEELATRVRNANRKLAVRIRELGPERVLFATDWPSWPPTRDLRMKLAQNARLLHEALPLTPDEWVQIQANVSPIFSLSTASHVR